MSFIKEVHGAPVWIDAGEETGVVTFTDIVKDLKLCFDGIELQVYDHLVPGLVKKMTVIITHCIVERDEVTEYSDNEGYSVDQSVDLSVKSFIEREVFHLKQLEWVW